MAIQYWSWIFIFQIMLARPGYAHVSHSYEVLAGRALEKVFVYVYLHCNPISLLKNFPSRNLSKAEKSRNTYIALAIAGSVVLVAGAIGLLLLYLRQREKVSEPESAIPKPHWWMVDSKNEKGDWKWKLGSTFSTPSQTDSDPDKGSRIERLRNALNIPRKNAKSQSRRPSEPSPVLPLQTDPNIQPRYPDSLERGYNAPVYHAQSTPQIPSVTMTLYDVNNPPKRTPSIPPRAIVTEGQRGTVARSASRSGVPRSPGSRRGLKRHSFRHPFLPLKDSDAPLKISGPTPVPLDLSNPKLGYSTSLNGPRTAPVGPDGSRSSSRPLIPEPSKPGMRKPPALRLLGEENSERKVRFGLPSSPRPMRAASPAM